MLNFRITRTVGKGAFGVPAADIRTVQTALSYIKGKTKFGMKPFFQGKTDGKSGPVTVAAIQCFQESENLKVTGRIEPTGPTMHRLRTKTPLTASTAIAAAQSGLTTSGNPAEAQAARRSVDDTLSDLLS